LCFISLTIIERIFYLSTYSRKNYFTLFLIAILISILFIFIKWIVNYQGFLGINTNEKIAKGTGGRNPAGKGRE